MPKGDRINLQLPSAFLSGIIAIHVSSDIIRSFMESEACLCQHAASSSSLLSRATFEERTFCLYFFAVAPLL